MRRGAKLKMAELLSLKVYIHLKYSISVVAVVDFPVFIFAGFDVICPCMKHFKMNGWMTNVFTHLLTVLKS